LTGKQKIHVFVTAQTAIYHCTIASYHCTFCVSLHTILCPARWCNLSWLELGSNLR